MRFAIVIIFLFLSELVKAQGIIGKFTTNNFSHTNNKHYEELELKSDSTFIYSTRIEFVKISKKGTWFAKDDSIVLTEENPCCKEKIKVIEKRNRRISKGKIKFFVTSMQDEEIDYHLIATLDDSTKTFWSQSGIIEIKAKRLKKFYFVVNSLIYSSEYFVKSFKSNEFRVRLAPVRFFYREKWLIKNDSVIVPMGWDNKYASYFLEKVN